MTSLTIAARDLRALFLSPLAWTCLAIVQVVLAYAFLVQLERFAALEPRLGAIPGAPGLTEIVVAPWLGTSGIVLLLLVPLVTMRLVSEERRAGTLGLLLSSPVSMSEIVIGKFLAIMGFIAGVLILIALMPLSLLAGGTLDFGLFASGMLGLALLGAGVAAAGLFFSTLTAQPAIAAVSTLGCALLLWMLDWSGEGGSGGLFAYLSLANHFDAMLRGIFNTRDVAYYLLLIITCLGLSIRRLDADRLQH